jgi:ATP-dependent Lon protease
MEPKENPIDEASKRRLLPLLPLRDIILFPHMVVPLFVGRDKSIAALDEAMSKDKKIILSAQKAAKVDNPKAEDIFRIGTIGTILQHLKLPDGTVKVLIEGQKRVLVKEYVPNDSFFLVYGEPLDDTGSFSVETEALVRSVHTTFEQFARLNKRIAQDLVNNVLSTQEPGKLADTIVAQLNLKLEDKQSVLETVDATERLEKIFGFLRGEIEILQVERKIKNRVKKQVERSQKEYYLNEQMRAIQKELGDRDEFKGDLKELEDSISRKKMSKEAMTKVRQEFKKLRLMSPMSAEATVVRNYIDTMIDLPWFEKSAENFDISSAEEILEEDHWGLKKVKERIVEYLAVQKLVGKIRGPILCLVGPPGVGKTSLGKSVARATGRRFIRLSLGGVRDEAEIRGHRRTYIGSMPGKIVQSLRKAKANNPVFLLDEVDKMSQDFRGDPASALLEVLDPEQNHAFADHYLDVDYDLSEIMFITTANVLHQIPAPLQDRMEIIRLPGYTEDEQFNIAKHFLIKKQFEANGLADKNVTLTDGAIYRVIREYTREAGVRNLEREIAAICRKIARKLAKGDADATIRVTPSSIPKYLGVPRYRFGQIEQEDMIGLATGLAWTEVGGEILSTEVALMPGKGNLTITGKLGDVMKESAQAALSYIRSRSVPLGIDPKIFAKTDIHIHIPEGAIPKDGPSAGITIATAIASAVLQVPVHRDVSMTGEITLRGRVLPIGGLKEKIIAAHRGLIKTIMIPMENEKDLREIPAKVLKDLEIIPVEHMDKVLKTALKLDDPEALFAHGDNQTYYRNDKELSDRANSLV